MMRLPKPPRVPARVLAGLAVLAVASAVGANVPELGAARLQQTGPTCTWLRLAAGEPLVEHTLVPYLDTGVLLFGGAEPRDSTISDTLRDLDLSGGGQGTWTRLTASGASPGKRAAHSAVLRRQEGETDQMILFGGIDVWASGGTFTWQSPLLGGSLLNSRRGEFGPAAVRGSTHRLSLVPDALTWQQIATGTTLNLTDHSGVYDSANDALVVFGGRTDEDARSASDGLWRLGLDAAAPSDWARGSASGGPSKRFAHTAVYDSIGRRMIVFGGTQDWDSAYNDVYALDLSKGWADASWSTIQAGGRSPGRRYDHAAVFVPNLNAMLVFGGSANGRSELNDLWALEFSQDPPAWRELEPGGAGPAGLWLLAAAYSEAQNMVVFQGGSRDDTTQRMTWGLRCEGAATPTPSDTPVPPTATHTASPEPVPPTETPTPTEVTPPTDTPVPATQTPSPTPTNSGGTVTPSATATPEPRVYLPKLENGVAADP